MSAVRVKTDSELYYEDQLSVDPGYWVVELPEPSFPMEATGHKKPVVLDGPFLSESFAIHIAQTRFGMSDEDEEEDD